MTEMKVTDEMLMAYADGELDGAEKDTVARLAATDPLIAARIARFARSRQAVKEAFAPIHAQPVPPALVAAVLGSGGEKRAQDNRILRWLVPVAATPCGRGGCGRIFRRNDGLCDRRWRVHGGGNGDGRDRCLSNDAIGDRGFCFERRLCGDRKRDGHVPDRWRGVPYLMRPAAMASFCAASPARAERAGAFRWPHSSRPARPTAQPVKRDFMRSMHFWMAWAPGAISGTPPNRT